MLGEVLSHFYGLSSSVRRGNQKERAVKRANIALSIAIMMGFCALSIQAAQADFSGTWVLDTQSIKGLPPTFGSYTIVVRQDAKQLVIDTQILSKGDAEAAKAQQPDTVGGNKLTGAAITTGSMGGNTAVFTVAPEATYSLDGKKTADRVPGIGDVTFRAKWGKDGKSLELWMVHTVVVDQLSVDTTSKEKWTLSEDGQSLKLQRTVSSQQGSSTANLTFRKKPGA
jgi:hypothetical protein